MCILRPELCENIIYNEIVKLDRIAEYRRAWKHFEKIFSNLNN